MTLSEIKEAMKEETGDVLEEGWVGYHESGLILKFKRMEYLLVADFLYGGMTYKGVLKDIIAGKQIYDDLPPMIRAKYDEFEKQINADVIAYKQKVDDIIFKFGTNKLIGLARQNGAIEGWIADGAFKQLAGRLTDELVLKNIQRHLK
jgi:hypothetical protein